LSICALTLLLPMRVFLDLQPAHLVLPRVRISVCKAKYAPLRAPPFLDALKISSFFHYLAQAGGLGLFFPSSQLERRTVLHVFLAYGVFPTIRELWPVPLSRPATGTFPRPFGFARRIFLLLCPFFYPIHKKLIRFFPPSARREFSRPLHSPPDQLVWSSPASYPFLSARLEGPLTLLLRAVIVGFVPSSACRSPPSPFLL